LNDFAAFKDIFGELESFDYYCEAYIKNTRLFEDIFRKIEASIRGFSKDNEVF
jgi:hypothetical protein